MVGSEGKREGTGDTGTGSERKRGEREGKRIKLLRVRGKGTEKGNVREGKGEGWKGTNKHTGGLDIALQPCVCVALSYLYYHE